ncbi:hypothetical protein [Staphylococcus saprophyticus]|uniref:hypothetical protein n=1 Tax=Staphylococcus saprophyticus TaxID=29385 RepID=UPI0019D00236|nr:hypothetical protein [Staphylococcus saprophyticus]MBN6755888.1 hypothetical protein [Staphylococcus saprophyticus]MBN6765866.1 hypothetical protein [Staphylococcus saprophyticus]MBN6771233.1 hypothetical protein [Staphylococcus saprophyticus]MBN6780201.1 hypothetical protein [Staphylococcus saprophyticus]MBN6787631.1 hypothetical protein [Staphylococcus saprophyticus]
MKIKTKKQLNLPQLIEWAWENKIKSHIIRADKQLMNIQFDEHGDFRTYGFTGIDTTFTIEIEEEITEDTVFKKLICLDVDDKYNIYDNVCVLDFDEDRVQAIYIPNDDLTMTLIWRDGKLVE